jgi:tripartite-type tricarboxylate transporter receptor subunit TctC
MYLRNSFNWKRLAVISAMCFVLEAGMHLSIYPSVAKAGEADSYPSRAVKILVVYPAGGGMDLNCRLFAKYASKKIGQNVLVINKPGAIGVTGLQEYFSDTSPDPYTIVADAMTSVSMLAAAMPNLPFDIWNRAWIGRYVIEDVFYVVPANSPWKTLSDVVMAAKKDPTSFMWGNGGFNSAGFACAQLFVETGIEVKKTKAIVYQGSGPNLVALAGGHHQFSAAQTAESASLIQAGKIRYLAVISKTRNPMFPDVPTVEEAGYPQLNIYGWQGLSAHPKLPNYVAEKWVKILQDTVNDPGYVQEARNAGKKISLAIRGDYRDFARGDYEKYKSLAPVFWNPEAKK